MKLLERKRTTDHEPLAQCPDCSGNGTVTLDQYNDGEFREGFCQTCEGKGSIPLAQYLLPIHEDEILAEEVEATVSADYYRALAIIKNNIAPHRGGETK